MEQHMVFPFFGVFFIVIILALHTPVLVNAAKISRNPFHLKITTKIIKQVTGPNLYLFLPYKSIFYIQSKRQT